MTQDGSVLPGGPPPAVGPLAPHNLVARVAS
jgi:hypothetical protein